jgi:hypothetical protein
MNAELVMQEIRNTRKQFKYKNRLRLRNKMFNSRQMKNNGKLIPEG